MKEKNETGGGYVRADQIDLKSLDEQLQRHLSRAWTMEKNKNRRDESEEGCVGSGVGGGVGGVGSGVQLSHHGISHRPISINTGRNVSRQEWEIEPSKLVIKSVIARGTFGTVHRGVYDGQDVAGIFSLLLSFIFLSFSFCWLLAVMVVSHVCTFLKLLLMRVYEVGLCFYEEMK